MKTLCFHNSELDFSIAACISWQAEERKVPTTIELATYWARNLVGLDWGFAAAITRS